MTAVTVLAVGGTGESHVGDSRTDIVGLLGFVTRELDARFDSRWIGYPASYGPVADGGLSFRMSTSLGADALTGAMSQTRRPVILIGYSQGCTVIREVLGRIALGGLPAVDVVAVGLISDPQQPVGVLDTCTGRGVAGDGPDIPSWIPVRWIGHPDDMICNASDDSFVRDIADLTRWMSFVQTRTWLSEIWELLRDNRFQNAAKTGFGPRQWRTDLRRIRTSIHEVLGYLPATLTWHNFRVHNPRGGRHVAYATEPMNEDGSTGCQILAAWIREQTPITTSAVHAA
ncbi:hypothetical protein ABH922_000919 [Rhodococcus sp. 27YEA15]|uniref:PE-PPE domain-containing protein n=1 Tax=Rhodococcus sp. 27YEA15 TaxID=3156259 RepID=UPI003C7B4AFA